MRSLAMFGIGIAVLVLAMLLPMFQSYILATVGFCYFAGVIVGFFIRPKTEVVYLRTKREYFDIDGDGHVEINRLALRIAVVRLWVLYVPTMGALAFLLWLYARNNYSLDIDLDRLSKSTLGSGIPVYLAIHAAKYGVVIVVSILVTWLRERFVLREVAVANAGSLQLNGAVLTYHFTDSKGDYFGGEGVTWGFRLPREIASIILYHLQNPERSIPARCLIFHTLEVIGRGLTDLDEETTEKHALPRPVESEG